MNFLQKSVWSSDVSSTIHHYQSSNTDTKSSINNNQWNIDLSEDETIENRQEYFDKIDAINWTCVRCFIIGLLLGGIVLAVIMTLWLSTPTTVITKISTTTTSTVINTSITTTTTTTKTTTTTSVTNTTTTTTPIPPCPPISVGSSSIIYNDSSGSQLSYVCHAFLWTSNITGTVNLTFQIQNLPFYWLLDDISVHDGAVEMLINGGFETGSLSPWIRTDPFGPCGGSAGRVDSMKPHTGIYHLIDGSDTCPDFISQSFTLTIGQIYTISFW